MLPAGFEPTIPASERPQTHTLDRPFYHYQTKKLHINDYSKSYRCLHATSNTVFWLHMNNKYVYYVYSTTKVITKKLLYFLSNGDQQLHLTQLYPRHMCRALQCDCALTHARDNTIHNHMISNAKYVYSIGSSKKTSK
jgi:hypothetical protein